MRLLCVKIKEIYGERCLKTPEINKHPAPCLFGTHHMRLGAAGCGWVNLLSLTLVFEAIIAWEKKPCENEKWRFAMP